MDPKRFCGVHILLRKCHQVIHLLLRLRAALFSHCTGSHAIRSGDPPTLPVPNLPDPGDAAGDNMCRMPSFLLPWSLQDGPAQAHAQRAVQVLKFLVAAFCAALQRCLGKILGFRREQKNPRSLHTWRSNMAVPVFFLMKNMVFHPLQSQAATFAIFIKARTSSASKGHGSSSSAVASSSCQRPAEWFPLSKSACHNVVCGMHEIVEEHRHMCVCVSLCVYMCVYYLCVCE